MRISLFFWALLLAAPAAAADLSNLRVVVEGNRVAITYDLKADHPAPVTVKGSEDGGRTWTVKMDHVVGDVGEAVRPGRGKVLYWEVLRDYPRGYGVRGVVFELTTSGGDFVDPVMGMEFVCVDGGTFQMGDLWGVGDSGEKPVHPVIVSDFCIGKTEVTQAQWQAVMGSNPSKFKGADRPVEKVSWEDVQVFIRKLNQKSGRRYRLPTEAEWEYAARSGGEEGKVGGDFQRGGVKALRLVPGEQWRPDPLGGAEAAQRVGAVRYERECVGVVLGLVWEELLSSKFGQ